MPFYPNLRALPLKERIPVIDNILSLQKNLRKEIPSKRLESNLLIATWNIREFGKNQKALRLPECFYYIAEIISTFDLVAVQEIGYNLTDLTTLMRLLGSDWDYIITDVTEGTSGNGERLAYLYDKRKVTFRKIAGEIVLPPKKGENPEQFARSPFIVAFQSGWFKFYIVTTHIYYGDDNKKGEKFARRVGEIEAISEFIAKRSKKERANYILLGDFNITGTTEKDATYQALLKGGFSIPEKIVKLSNRYSNKNQDKPYDQIAYIDQPGFMEFGEEERSAGIFNFFNHVFTDKFKSNYKKYLNKLDYETWKTFQMSDHLPLWMEFNVNYSENYLKRLRKEKGVKKPS